jgi:alpha/beta superfamily hydrolase
MRRIMHQNLYHNMRRSISLSLVFIWILASSFAHAQREEQLAGCKGVLKRFPVQDLEGQHVGEGTYREFLPTRVLRQGRAVVIPPTGGENAIDKSHAKNLCLAGYPTQILVSWPMLDMPLINLRIHDANMIRVREAFQSLLGEDDRPLALIGTSLGGIISSHIVAHETRIKAVVFIVAGTDLAQILATSDHEMVVKQRRERMKLYNLKTAAEYEQLLQSAITQEPSMELKQISDLPPSLHIIATKDTAVPTHTQVKLSRLFPNPEILRLNTGHFWGIVASGTSKKEEIADFIQRHVP